MTSEVLPLTGRKTRWDDAMKIHLRSIITDDVKLARLALESIGFTTVEEGDAVDAYWIELDVPAQWVPKGEE